MTKHCIAVHQQVGAFRFDPAGQKNGGNVAIYYVDHRDRLLAANATQCNARELLALGEAAKRRATMSSADVLESLARERSQEAQAILSNRLDFDSAQRAIWAITGEGWFDESEPLFRLADRTLQHYRRQGHRDAEIVLIPENGDRYLLDPQWAGQRKLFVCNDWLPRLSRHMDVRPPEGFLPQLLRVRLKPATATTSTGRDVAVHFDWSPPAAHHDAVVIVQQGSSMGSGVYVCHEGNYLILTAAHVAAGGQATATFRDGVKLSGAAYSDKYSHDVSAIIIDRAHPRVTPLVIAASDPQVGEWVELLGFGGPKNVLRHWWGQVRQVQGDQYVYDAGIAAGDSGGPILNDQLEVVGLGCHGLTGDNPTEGWRTHDVAGGPACGPIRSFAQRIVQRFGQPGGI